MSEQNSGRITLLAGCSWYPSRLLKSTVHHRLYIQWVVSNQCNIICATYSLMGTGLHGENGLDPETSISLLKTYILPISTYGL
jgi:hypothetical protein